MVFNQVSTITDIAWPCVVKQQIPPFFVTTIFINGTNEPLKITSHYISNEILLKPRINQEGRGKVDKDNTPSWGIVLNNTNT